MIALRRAPRSLTRVQPARVWAFDGGQPAARQANKRGAARLAAVQALYQMDVAGSGMLEIAAEYEAFRLGKEVDGALYREADAQWFRAILSGVVENQKTVDPVIRQALTEDWPLSRLDSTLRAILRAGVFEIMKRDDVPVAVIVSEYVDIAKAFYRKTSRSWSMPCSTASRASCAARAAARTRRDRDAGRTRGAAHRDHPVGVAGDRRLGCRGRISLGALAGQYLLGPDKSLATAPVTGFNLGVALGALPAAAIIRLLGQRNGFITGGLVTAAGGAIAAAALYAPVLAVSASACWCLASAAPSCSNTVSPPPTTRRPNSRHAPSPSFWRAGSSPRSSARRSSSSHANCWRR